MTDTQVTADRPVCATCGAWLDPDGSCFVCNMWPTEPPSDPDEPLMVPVDQVVEVPSRLFADVAALLDGGIPPAPAPVLLAREDGHHLFYREKVNVLFGDPESGKTWIALAALAEALRAGRRGAFIDLDHNGVGEVVQRLLLLGAPVDALRNPGAFRYAEPEDGDELITVVQVLRAWRPAAVVVDSLGELLPMLGLSSNSPDDYTSAHRRVLTPIANAGGVVIAVDHMPKSEEARAHGQTGTVAKKRAVNGVTLRVTLTQAFAPGRGGTASMTVEKDRPGGVRAHCPGDGKNPPAGRFIMSVDDQGLTSWRVTAPRLEAPTGGGGPDADVAELDSLVPPPRTKRDVQDRLGWGSNRAQNALARWRDLQRPTDE